MFKVGLTGGIGTGKSYIGKLFSVYGVRIIDSDVIARVVVLPGSPTLEAIAAHFGPQVIAADGTLNRRALREIVFSDQAHLAELNGLIHPAIHELINQYTALAEQNRPFPEVYHLTAALQQADAKAAHAQQLKTQLKNKSLAPLSPEERAQRLSEQALIEEPLDPAVVFLGERAAPYVILDIPLLFENHWDQVVDTILVVDCDPEIQLARVMKRDQCTKELAAQIIARQCPRDFKLAHADYVINTDSPSIADKRQAVLNLHYQFLSVAQATRGSSPA